MIILPIIPSRPQVPVNTQQIIPNFNHVPVTPVIMPSYSNNISLEEKERLRLEKQRQHKARYDQKVKSYAKIGTLQTETDKIKAVLLLYYSSLTDMHPYELDIRVPANAVISPISLTLNIVRINLR